MRFFGRFSAVVLALLLPAAGASAQGSEGVRIGAGLGRSTLGMAIALEVDHGFMNGRLTERLLTVTDASLLEYDSETAGEIGVLYGRGSRSGRLWRSFGIGLSAVEFTYTSSFDEEEHPEGWTVGIPLQAQLQVQSGRFAIGGSAFVTLNPKQTYAGAMLSAAFRLRPAPH